MHPGQLKNMVRMHESKWTPFKVEAKRQNGAVRQKIKEKMGDIEWQREKHGAAVVSCSQ